MELSFRLVLAIVVGIIIVMAIVVMFWGTISKFMPWSTGTQEFVVASGTQTLIISRCDMDCLTKKDAIRAGATWQIGYDVNLDGHEETISCKDGSIISWGNNNQPAKCGGIGCVKSCSCVDNAWYQAPKTC